MSDTTRRTTSTSNEDCGATCWHGRGHQSMTQCDGTATHDLTEDGEIVHVARRSWTNDLMWTGMEGRTGFFDENLVAP